MVHVVELLFSSDEVETLLNVPFCRRRRWDIKKNVRMMLSSEIFKKNESRRKENLAVVSMS